MKIAIDIERMNADELKMLRDFLYRENEMRDADLVDKFMMYCEGIISYDKWQEIK